MPLFFATFTSTPCLFCQNLRDLSSSRSSVCIISGGIFVNLVIIDERIGKQEEERRMAMVKHKFDQVFPYCNNHIVGSDLNVVSSYIFENKVYYHSYFSNNSKIFIYDLSSYILIPVKCFYFLNHCKIKINDLYAFDFAMLFRI